MTGSIGIPDQLADTAAEEGRRLVPMKIGDAVVYIEPFDESATLEDEGGLRPVGADPQEAFEAASRALRECVRVVGERITEFEERMTPATVGMEFTLTFDVEGKATIVPVLLTGKAKTAFGIKVSAQWHPRGTPPAGP